MKKYVYVLYDDPMEESTTIYKAFYDKGDAEDWIKSQPDLYQDMYIIKKVEFE